MKTISCLFLICLTAFAAAESGLKLTITPKAIGAFKDQLLPQVVAKLQNLEIPPITTGGLTVSNFTLKTLSLPSELLNVQFSSSRVFLSSASFGVQARFHIDYTLWGFIPIVTTIEVSTSQSTLALGLSVENDHLITVGRFDVSIQKLDIQFPEAYLKPVYHALTYVLSWPIQSIISSVINSNVKTAIQAALDDAVATVPGFIVIPNTTFGVDYQITQNPKVTSNYLTVYINGTFYDGTKPFAVPPVNPPRDFPEFDAESGHHIQAFISEYVLNTGLYQVFQSGIMKVNVTNDMMPPEAGIKFSTKWLKQFIPNIYNYYNESTNITMELKVVSNPVVTISKGAMKVSAGTQLAFYFFDNDNVTQIVQAQSTLEVNANVTLANWTAKPNIISAAFGPFTIEKSNVGELTGDKFQQGFNILFLFAIGGFNAQFQPIVLPQVPGVSLETSAVTYEEGHIRIQASPAYGPVPFLALPAQRNLRTEKI